jgi:cell division protein FtsB
VTPPAGRAYALLLAPALAIVLALASLAFDEQRSVRLLWELRTAVAAERTRVADLEQERGRLVARIRALRRDPVAVEAVARERLGMVRPGEIVIRWHAEVPPMTR